MLSVAVEEAAFLRPGCLQHQGRQILDAGGPASPWNPNFISDMEAVAPPDLQGPCKLGLWESLLIPPMTKVWSHVVPGHCTLL